SDAQDGAAADENRYTRCLSCLRELSLPTTDAKYPEVMRTRGWAMKTLNTQLASWAQLRHDTVLYAKQSYTFNTLCEYPAGYVEPLPQFWARFEKMAGRAADLLDTPPFPEPAAGQPGPGPKAAQQRQAEFFRSFAKQLGMLRGIA